MLFDGHRGSVLRHNFCFALHIITGPVNTVVLLSPDATLNM